MKIPVFVVSGFFGVTLALQAWMATEIIALKVSVATLSVQIKQQTNLAKNNQ